jgi:hypothetical protein
MSYNISTISGIKKSGGSLSPPSSLAVDQQLGLNATGFSLTGASISSGSVTLNAGGWVLMAGIYLERDGSQSTYTHARWYDVTNDEMVGSTAGAWVASSAQVGWYSGTLAWAVVTPSVSTEYEMRITSWSGVTSGISMEPGGAIDPMVYDFGEPWYAIMSM